MRSLASLVALSTATGTRCPLEVIRGLLRNGITLDVWWGGAWKQLASVRTVIPAAAVADVYLCTTDGCAYLTQPDDLIRARITGQNQAGVHVPRTQKAGETP